MKPLRAFSSESIFIFLITFFLAGSIFFYQHITQQYAKADLVSRAYIVKITFNQLLLNLDEAETSQRSYLLTQDPGFLQRYQEDLTKIRSIIALLDTLNAGNYAQQEGLRDLHTSLNNSLLALSTGSRFSSPLPPSGEEAGDLLQEVKTLIDNLKSKVFTLIQQENQLLQQRIKERDNMIMMDPVLIINILLSIAGLIALAYLQLRKETIRRMHSENNKALLENKVQERTRDLAFLNEQLATQNNIFAHAERVALIGSYTWRLASGEMQFSDNLYRMLGYQPGEFKPVFDRFIGFLHPTDRRELLKNGQNSLKSRILAEESYRMITKDGIIKYFRSTGTLLYKGEDEVMIGTFQDITRETELRQSLQSKTEALLVSTFEKESAQRFKTLADSMPQIVWTATPEGSIDYFNKKWNEFTGDEKEEILQDSWRNMIHPDDLPGFVRRLRQSLRTGKALQVEFRLRRQLRETSWCWFLGKALPIYNQEHKIVKWYGTFTDINDLKLAQLEIQKLVKEKEDFISIASHELKTPVTSLKASLQFLERAGNTENLSEEILQLIDMGNRQVNKLTRMVGDLLDVAKLDSDKIELKVTEFSLREAINDSLEQIRFLLKKHRVRLQGALDIKITANKERIEQVITNFISNAIKYSPRSDEIILESCIQSDEIKVSVTDTGIGIPAEKIPFVFDRFFRVEGASDKFSGLGLGLYISSEIISRHQGRIGLQSQQDKGSTFWFSLPLSLKGQSKINEGSAATGAGELIVSP